jgi:hypothetical protein
MSGAAPKGGRNHIRLSGAGVDRAKFLDRGRAPGGRPRTTVRAQARAGPPRGATAIPKVVAAVWLVLAAGLGTLAPSATSPRRSPGRTGRLTIPR